MSPPTATITEPTARPHDAESGTPTTAQIRKVQRALARERGEYVTVTEAREVAVEQFRLNHQRRGDVIVARSKPKAHDPRENWRCSS